MLETIDISKNLPQSLKKILEDNIGHIYGLQEVEKTSNNKLLISTYNDKIEKSGFAIIYTNSTNNIVQEETVDYFQPFKYNDSIDKIDTNLFLNYVLGHIERLQLSPTIKNYHETILTCD